MASKSYKTALVIVLTCICLALIAVAVTLAVLLTKSDVKTAQELCDEYWNWRLDQAPEFATYLGDTTRNDKLESYSLSAWKQREEDMKLLLEDINNTEENLDLSEADATNLKILKQEIQLFLDGLPYKGYFFPINFLEGIQLDFATLISYMPIETVKDYENILSRFDAFPTQVDEIIEILEEAINQGFAYPAEAMKGVIAQFQSYHVEFPNQSVFYEPFEKIPPSFEDSIRDELQTKSLVAIEDKVLPALQKLENFMENDYMKNLRKDIAISSVPNGGEMYEQLITYYAGTSMSAETVHEIGNNEVNRILENMFKIVESQGFENKSEFDEWLKTNETNFYDNSDDIIAAYRKIVFELVDPLLPEWFKHLPKQPVLVEPAPDTMPNAPTGFYMPGTIDTPGTFFVNVADPKYQPIPEMVSLSLHEAQPGHHTQIALSIENTAIHEFRRNDDTRKYGEAPTHFPVYGAYVEGWALYSEKLGEEMEVYKNELELYGRYLNEMLRACRLVVDSGMHALGWSRQQAIDFMKENLANADSTIENEIDRYIAWPGQALSYKLGEIKIVEERERAERELGEKFSIKEFHDLFLQLGSVNLDLFAEAISDYITSE